MDGMATASPLGLDLDMTCPDGRAVLAAIMKMAEQAIDRLNPEATVSGSPGAVVPGAGVGRLRGTGPGVSFRGLVDVLEADHPVELRYPFEENERVGGAIWPGALVGEGCSQALMKLRWEAGAHDLPMHTHEHSDRFIIVLKGRGFFHLNHETVAGFTGSGVQTIAARERDVFVLRRGTMHTFSTFDDAMELLSCHLPYIPLDDPRQYTLPSCRWIAGDRLGVHSQHAVTLQGWSPITPSPQGINSSFPTAPPQLGGRKTKVVKVFRQGSCTWVRTVGGE